MLLWLNNEHALVGLFGTAAGKLVIFWTIGKRL